MEFRTTFDIASPKQKLQHGDKIISLGSCFSENIGQKLAYFGWDVLNNPFGTIFHPLALSNLLLNAINGDTKIRVCVKNDLFYSYEAHSLIAGTTENELKENYEKALLNLLHQLENCSHLFITFGSAWAYLLNDEVVANCHQQSNSQFKKELTGLTELQIIWRILIETINRKFPNIQIIITVSPVRHLKDGIVENQRSKARLIELVTTLNDATYFPAYELMMDDLRDYRFYNQDKIHPSEEAIDYIFERFTSTFIGKKSADLFPTIDKLRKGEQHRSITGNSESFKQFKQKHTEQMTSFLAEHQQINW